MFNYEEFIKWLDFLFSQLQILTTGNIFIVL